MDLTLERCFWHVEGLPKGPFLVCIICAHLSIKKIQITLVIFHYYILQIGELTEQLAGAQSQMERALRDKVAALNDLENAKLQIKRYDQEVSLVGYYTPGIYAKGYIVFVFPFVRSYVRSFVCSFVRSFVRSYFLPSRGICVKVLR